MVTESAYRGPDETLRATLAALTQRASEVGARVDRGYLTRFDVGRLARLSEMWRAAGSAATEALAPDSGSTEALVRACDAHRVLIAELENLVATGADHARVASVLERERVDRANRRFDYWFIVIMLLILVAGGLYVLTAFGIMLGWFS